MKKVSTRPPRQLLWVCMVVIWGFGILQEIMDRAYDVLPLFSRGKISNSPLDRVRGWCILGVIWFWLFSFGGLGHENVSLPRFTLLSSGF